jgi:hypothetical protein
MGSARVGTVVHEFTVPAPGDFRVSTPVITDTREAEGEPVPLARREFERGRPLFCHVEVFGAQKDEAGMPQVVMGYAVMGKSGAAVAFAEPTLIRPTSIGHLSRFVELGMEAAPPGDYELVMAFRDMLSGKFLEMREPFSVRALESAGAVPPAARESEAGP